MFFFFTEKCFTLGQGFYSKFFCCPCVRVSQLFLPVMHRQIKKTSFYYAEELFSVVGINVCKKSSFQLIKKWLPSSNSVRKQTLESRIIQIKLCKENHRVQSKVLDLAFWTKFRFETKLGCFVTRYCAFAHCYLSTHFLNLQ